MKQFPSEITDPPSLPMCFWQFDKNHKNWKNKNNKTNKIQQTKNPPKTEREQVQGFDIAFLSHTAQDVVTTILLHFGFDTTRGQTSLDEHCTLTRCVDLNVHLNNNNILNNPAGFQNYVWGSRVAFLCCRIVWAVQGFPSRFLVFWWSSRAKPTRNLLQKSCLCM